MITGMIFRKVFIFSALLLCVLSLGVSEINAADYGSSKNQSTAGAVLYYSTSCSHCKDVLAYLQKNRKSVTIRDIGNPQYRKEWQALGQQGVPVLVANGRVIVGSTPIISYLSKN